MPRPTKRRRICGLPQVTEFAPDHACDLSVIEMTVDEYEAIRLIDLLDLSQEEAARQMQVARTTVQAIYLSARKKLAESLVQGRRLRIQGGSYSVCPRAADCCGHSCRGRDCEGTCAEKCCDCGCDY